MHCVIFSLPQVTVYTLSNFRGIDSFLLHRLLHKTRAIVYFKHSLPSLTMC